MKFRQRNASELDQPTRWNQYLKPWFDVAGYQHRLDERIGLDKDGACVVRLVWGQDVRQSVWDERTPRYWLRRQGATYWTVPRWIFEVRLPRELYVGAWERSRYSAHSPDGGDVRCGDCGFGSEPPLLVGNQLYCRKCAGTNVVGGAVVDKGPPPPDYFNFLHVAARHEAVDLSGEPACCTRAFYSDTKFGTPHSRCWGDYRPPTDDDLDLVVRTVDATKSSPYEPLTPQQLAETELAAMKQVERAEEQLNALQAAAAKEVTDAWFAGRIYSGAGGPLRKPTAIENILKGITNPHS